MTVLGFDTSNYTTSIAAFDGKDGTNVSRLLDVQPGALGLRQSDALFSHVKRLPELAEQLFEVLGDSKIDAVGVSTRPRAVEGSYMPCFLAGESQARVLSAALQVPLFCVSHQQGHIAAALWSAGRLELMEQPFLSWHLSGGTTELLLVTPENGNVHAERIGGTTDISAGQVIDRTGKLLSLSFPAGKALDALSAEGTGKERFKVRLDGLAFSLSGLENKVAQYHAAHQKPAETAAYALRSLCSIIVRASEEALRRHPGLPILFSGGVASNRMLRAHAASLKPIFAAPQFSTDNAMGTAVLAYRLKEKTWSE